MDNEWKVFCVDTFDGERWRHGKYNSREEAEEAARFIAGPMLRAHVENPKGVRVVSFGTH
jgi:hypothetical protein